MRVVVIGGTGHIGGYLVSQLREDGHEVVVVTSGRTAAPELPGWEGVRLATGRYNRGDAAWKKLMAGLSPEVVIDILGADLPGTYDAVRKTAKQYVVCGSVWMFGAPVRVPAPEEAAGPALSAGYARRFAEMQETLARSQAAGLPLTAIMPPNICGPRTVPLDCKGTRSVALHRAHRRGEPVLLPDGINTLIGPCDASDVAQGFRVAVRNRDAAAGKIFNVGAPYALTIPQFVQAYAEIYGTKIPIEYIPSDRFYRDIIPEPGDAAHFRYHMCPDISRIAQLGYRPQFTCEQTMARAVAWMNDQKLLD